MESSISFGWLWLDEYLVQLDYRILLSTLSLILLSTISKIFCLEISREGSLCEHHLWLNKARFVTSKDLSLLLVSISMKIVYS